MTCDTVSTRRRPRKPSSPTGSWSKETNTSGSGDPRPRRPTPVACIGDVERALLVQVPRCTWLLRQDHHRTDAAEDAGRIGENAGVVDIGDGWLSRSRPSRTTPRPNVEPTRARPPGRGDRPGHHAIGPPAAVGVVAALRRRRPDTRPVLPGVVPRRRYGNCLGLPNGGARSSSTPARRQPAGQRAVCGCDSLRPAPGVRVRYRTRSSCSGADWPGRHRRVSCSPRTPSRRRDLGRPPESCRRAGRRPVHREVLIECCPSCSARSSWSAFRTSWRGPVVRHERAGQRGDAYARGLTVFRCAPRMTPAEILSSESQERMCAVVPNRPMWTRSWRLREVET